MSDTFKDALKHAYMAAWFEGIHESDKSAETAFEDWYIIFKAQVLATGGTRGSAKFDTFRALNYGIQGDEAFFRDLDLASFEQRVLSGAVKSGPNAEQIINWVSIDDPNLSLADIERKIEETFGIPAKIVRDEREGSRTGRSNNQDPPFTEQPKPYHPRDIPGLIDHLDASDPETMKGRGLDIDTRDVSDAQEHEHLIDEAMNRNDD